MGYAWGRACRPPAGRMGRHAAGIYGGPSGDGLDHTGNLGNIRNNASFDFGIAAYPGNPEPASVLGGGNLYIFEGASDEQKEASFRPTARSRR